DLHPELVRLSRLPLAYALHLRGMQCVQLALVLRTLRMQPLGAIQPRPKCRFGRLSGIGQLAFDVANHPAQYRALATQHTAHPLELLGVCIAASTATERGPFPFVALPQ